MSKNDEQGSRLYRTPYGNMAELYYAIIAWSAFAMLGIIGAHFAHIAFRYAAGDSLSNFMTWVVGIGIVGICYTVEFMLYRSRHFAMAHIGVVAFVVLLLGSFDYVGLYGWSGYSDALENKRGEVIRVVEEFDYSAQKKLGTVRGELQSGYHDKVAELEKERARRKTDIEGKARESRTASERRILDKQFRAEEERIGARVDDSTTGVIGYGDRTIDREAEARRYEGLERESLSALTEWEVAEKALIDTEVDAEIAKLEGEQGDTDEAVKAAEAMLKQLTSVESTDMFRGSVTREDSAVAGKTVMEAILESDNLIELSKAARFANQTMSRIAGLLGIESRDAVVEAENVIGMAFRMLGQGDTTALFSYAATVGLQLINLLAAIVIHADMNKPRRKEDDELDESERRVIATPDAAADPEAEEETGVADAPQPVDLDSRRI